MSEDPPSAKFPELITRTVQIGAILAAGSWGVFEFGLLETRKNFVIEIDVSATAGAPLQGGKLVPVTIDSTLRNTGDKGVFILYGLAIIGEEGFEDDTEASQQFPDFNSGNGENLHFMATGGERHFMAPLGIEFFTPYYWLDKTEAQKSQIVFLVPAVEERMFSYQIIYMVARLCSGVFPFETCYEFNVETWPSSEDDPCPGDRLDIAVTELCVQYSRAPRTKGDYQWEDVDEVQLVDEHGLIPYSRRGIVIFRKADGAVTQAAK